MTRPLDVKFHPLREFNHRVIPKGFSEWDAPDQPTLEPRKNTLTFHYIGCLIGIMAYNPDITERYNPRYLKQLEFFHCTIRK